MLCFSAAVEQVSMALHHSSHQCYSGCYHCVFQLRHQESSQAHVSKIICILALTLELFLSLCLPLFYLWYALIRTEVAQSHHS